MGIFISYFNGCVFDSSVENNIRLPESRYASFPIRRKPLPVKNKYASFRIVQNRDYPSPEKLEHVCPYKSGLIIPERLGRDYGLNIIG
jgi:hypothetical protein